MIKIVRWFSRISSLTISQRTRFGMSRISIPLQQSNRDRTVWVNTWRRRVFGIGPRAILRFVFARSTRLSCLVLFMAIQMEWALLLSRLHLEILTQTTLTALPVMVQWIIVMLRMRTLHASRKKSKAASLFLPWRDTLVWREPIFSGYCRSLTIRSRSSNAS